jgi:hypothetical protein
MARDDFPGENAENADLREALERRVPVFAYESEERSYSPFIGLAVAQTWGDLARWVNRLRAADTDAAELDVALEWADEVNACDRRADYAVNPGDLIAFAKTVTDILERKLKGEPIAAEAKKLMAPMSEVELDDENQRLVWHENRNAFWASEYYFLFARLSSDLVWWKAVGYCDNEKCRKFFIRQRADNRFDSDKCRQNAANRKFYKRRARSHGGPK